MNETSTQKIQYSAVVLNHHSRQKLEMLYQDTFNEFSWRLICHHMTLNMGPLDPKFGTISKDEVFARPIRLKILKIGKSDKAAAVLVEAVEHFEPDLPVLSKDIKLPHVTLAVNPDGGKPVMSNDITEWQDVDVSKYPMLHFHGDGFLYVYGTIQEIPVKNPV